MPYIILKYWISWNNEYTGIFQRVNNFSDYADVFDTAYKSTAKAKHIMNTPVKVISPIYFQSITHNTLQSLYQIIIAIN